MKISIIGYGKMGKLLENAAVTKGIEIVAILDDFDKLSSSELPKETICIDFSTPEGFMQNLNVFLSQKYRFVVGTTGWYDDFEKVKNKIVESNVACCYGANFSLSVHYFNKIIDLATSKLENLNNLNIEIDETHHTSKKDSPSGTAISLKNIISKYHKEEVKIYSHRIGDVIGQHKVSYRSENENIDLIHDSKSKLCYAEGALLCAEYLVKHHGFFCANQIFDEIL